MSGYADWFSNVTRFDEAHGWQLDLAASEECVDRLIRIPTGFGNSEGVLCAWLWNAVDQRRNDWPRRLVWCLPMRVLVEQTASRAQTLLDRWAKESGCSEPPKVHLLMGGQETEPWHLDPASHAVLVGTQDMLLSRALNRGYASGRARWPAEFGLLNQDCLWIMDEVQLMDVGLATSAQIQAFRSQNRQFRTCRTWWMSATLQPDWLRSVDTAEIHKEWIKDPCIIPSESRNGGLWAISKPVTAVAIDARDTQEFASRILSEHAALEESDFGRITLVVCNTVQRACETHAALQAAGRVDGLELVHSRFRPNERAGWQKTNAPGGKNRS
jgi:CRISPR-associated endonuclease/helicase Cas3